jgi:hypothetical protein
MPVLGRCFFTGTFAALTFNLLLFRVEPVEDVGRLVRC